MSLTIKSDKAHSGVNLPHYQAMLDHQARVIADGGTIPSADRCLQLLRFLACNGFDLADCYVYGAEFGIKENAGAITKFYNPAHGGMDALVNAGTVTKNTVAYPYVTASTSNSQQIRTAGTIPIGGKCIIAGASNVAAPGYMILAALNPFEVYSSTENVAQLLYNDTANTNYGFAKNDVNAQIQILSSVAAVGMDGLACLITGAAGSIYANGAKTGSGAFTSKKLNASVWVNIVAGVSTAATMGVAIVITDKSATEANAQKLSAFLGTNY